MKPRTSDFTIWMHRGCLVDRSLYTGIQTLLHRDEIVFTPWQHLVVELRSLSTPSCPVLNAKNPQHINSTSTQQQQLYAADCSSKLRSPKPFRWTYWSREMGSKSRAHLAWPARRARWLVGLHGPFQFGEAVLQPTLFQRRDSEAPQQRRQGAIQS
jgi:hypothetical protein